MRWILTAMLLGTLQVRAHQIDEIAMELETGTREWTAIVTLDAAYMLPEYRGDADIAPFDLAWLRTRTPDEWRRIQEESRKFLTESLRIGGGANTIEFPDFKTDPPDFMTNGIPEALPEIQAVISGSVPQGPLNIKWNEPFGVVLIIGHESGVLPLVSGETVEFGSKGPGPPSFTRWMRLGFEHVVRAGLDHVLFILGIFLLSPKWKPLLYQSLVFTFAHSITLAATAMGWLTFPDRWIETLIALSIAWVAIENLMGRDIGTPRYLVIGVFGLIHGLGFARMLAGLLPESGDVLGPLIGFNLGVEAGQIATISAVWIMAGWWRESAFARLRVLGSTGIALVAVVWAIQRAFQL